MASLSILAQYHWKFHRPPGHATNQPESQAAVN